MSRRPCIALLAAALLAGCGDDSATSPAVEQAAHSLLGGLEVGESYTLAGAEASAIYLNGGAGPEGSEYIIVPFHRSSSAAATLQFEMTGEGTAGGGDAAAAVSPQPEAGSPTFDGRPILDGSQAHMRLRSRQTRQMNERLRSAGRPLADGLDAMRDEASGPRAAVAEAGDLIELNVQADSACSNTVYRTGRVVTVTERAVVVADTSNPAGGFTDAEYQAMGEEFDELVHPLMVETFGEPTDRDENGDRVIIFFTSAVNDLTEPGSGRYVGGFFYARDLFPTSDPNPDVACAGSNEAEMFYMMVPDPERGDQEPAFAKDFVARNAMGIIGHEFQHLINASRRIYVNGAETYEEVWLDEGLSHMAEELLYYEATGLNPGRNITIETLAGSQARIDAANRFIVSNLARYGLYLQSPVSHSLFGSGSLETRGAIWAFLRYAADHDERSDRELLHELANSQESGFANLNAAFDGEALERARNWVASIYVDDTVGAAPERFQQPSWNFRSVVPALYQSQQFPLDVRWLELDRPQSLSLQGGGAAFLELQADPSKRPSVQTREGGGGAPDGLEITVIRTR